MRQQKKYNYFYKITNNINNHYYYYGIHSTDNINDGYMGSGYRLQYAYKNMVLKIFLKIYQSILIREKNVHSMKQML